MWGSAEVVSRRPVPSGFALPELQPGDDVGLVFVAQAASGELALPRPGAGRTAERFAALSEMAAVDLSLGRLVEGHTDADAVLAEAGIVAPPGAVMGVWAARRGDADVTATALSGGWRLVGRKPWASGAHLLTHALVTASTDNGPRLFLVEVNGTGVEPVEGTWPAVGMAWSDSLDVSFDVVVGRDACVGGADWYVKRPGFWFGSAGVAACWMGGAIGLVRALATDLLGYGAPDAHQIAHLGAAAASCAAMARSVEWAAGLIDLDPGDSEGGGRAVALELRHLVEDGCLDVAVRVGRAGGAGPLCRDAAQARRYADLAVYIRQHHAERDSEALGRLVLDRAADPTAGAE